MSLGSCLPGLVETGKLTPEQAENARTIYDELFEEFARSGSRESAEALASQAALEALERQVTRKDFLAGQTIRVQQRIAADLRGYRDAKRAAGGGRGEARGAGRMSDGPIDPNALPALIDHDPGGSLFSNVEGRRRAIVGQAHRLMDGVLADFSANLLGRVRNRPRLREMTRELFGESTGNQSARELAEAWRRTAEMLRRRFNAAGGEIGFRADWGLPQSHAWKKIRAAGFDQWRAFILPRLDPEKMIDARTGRPFTREGLEAALPEIFDTIRSNGANKMTPGAMGGKALANRRAEERFFVFRDADAWSEYAEAFGQGTAYDAMMRHIEGMARDIAAMEVLGPNPEATLRWAKDTVEQSARLDRSPDTKAVSKAREAGKKADALWAEYTLATQDPRNEALALGFSAIRSWQTATKLGGAYLSAMGDFGFQFTRRRMNGLSTLSMLPDYLRLMMPGSGADQRLAVRRGLIAEEWSSRTAAQSRFLGDELTGEIPRRLAEGVLRLSLLSRHTQHARWLHGMETLATYTEAVGQSFDQLAPRLRGALQRYGMGAAEWDKLRTAPMDVDRRLFGGRSSEVEWISPHNLEDQVLAARFMEMIHEETDLAVPVADLATRSTMYVGERGTWMGETVRSALLFKSFGIGVVLRQSREIMAIGTAEAYAHGAMMGAMLAARYAASLMIATTLGGAVALQMKELARGRDPRPMNTREFWGAAMAQGGGFGIWGDFLTAAENRAGGGLGQTLAGPLADDLQGIANLALAKDPRRSVVREVKGFMPGNNLWYTRLAFDRMMADQIEDLVNPEYAAAKRRMHRRAADEGTSFWWRPGEAQPARAPDFANALEEGPRR